MQLVHAGSTRGRADVTPRDTSSQIPWESNGLEPSTPTVSESDSAVLMADNPGVAQEVQVLTVFTTFHRPSTRSSVRVRPLAPTLPWVMEASAEAWSGEV